MRQVTHQLWISVLVIFLSFGSYGQKYKNPKVIIDTLDNGFRYIIHNLVQEVDQNEVGLVVEVGSSHDGIKELEHAHLLEHVAMNSVESYRKLKGNSELLAKYRLKNRDIHAFTHNTHTYYQFNYTKYINEALNFTLDYFYELASGRVLFSKELVDAERKAVYQEYVLGQPASSYARSRIIKELFQCKRPITKPGDYEKLLNESSEISLKRYYKEWYRPDLMTLVMVGNFKDVNGLRERIKRMFKDIKRPEHPPRDVDCNTEYLQGSGKYLIVNSLDNHQSKNQFQFYYRKDEDHFKNLSTYEESELWHILTPIIGNRLTSLNDRYNISYTANFYPNLLQNSVYLYTSEESERNVTELFSNLSGLNQWGVTNKELEKSLEIRLSELKNPKDPVVRRWSSFYEMQVRDQTEDFTFHTKERISFLEGLTVGQVNEYLNDYSWSPDDISIVLPKDGDPAKVGENQVLKWIKKGLRTPVRSKMIKGPEELLGKIEKSNLRPKQIVKSNKGPYGQELFTLDNGLKLVLQQTHPSEGRYKDKIMMYGISPFGASCFGPDDYEAILSPLIVKNGGYGSYDKFEMDSYLSKTSFAHELRHYVLPNETGFEGAVRLEEMDKFLQLIYLSFTSPRFDEVAFLDWQRQIYQSIGRISRPADNFLGFVDQQTGDIGVPRGMKLYEESVKIDYQKAFNKYRELFSNAQDFTVFVVGDFEKEDVLPSLEKYLGNLPNELTQRFSKDHGCNTPVSESPNNKEVNFEFSEFVDNTHFLVRFDKPIDTLDYKTLVKLELLSRALGLKLKKLRYDKHLGVYHQTPTNSVYLEKLKGTVGLYVKCAKYDFGKIKQSCNEFINELKNEPLDEASMAIVKQSGYLTRWKNRNKSIINGLIDYHRHNLKMVPLETVEEYVENFTAEDLRKVAIKYFADDAKLTVIGSSK